LTSSSSAAKRRWGQQEPRIAHFPDVRSSLGDEFLEVAELAGMQPDPWQRFAVQKIMGLRPDGQLASPRAGVCVPRQNGKGAVLEILELGRLFVLESPLTIHSAHLFKTSKEAYLRIRHLVQNCPELDARVRRYPATNGDEGIILKNGCRLGFVARTSGGGRGLTGDCVILDEAMYLPDAVMSSLTYTVSARKFNQIIYTGSAVDQMSMPDGRAFSILRNEGIKGDADWLTYLEWSLPYDNPDDVPPELLRDREAWLETNPALNIRITEETVERELLTGPRSFAVERLNVGDWPSPDGAQTVIDLGRWNSLTADGDRHAAENQLGSPLCFCFDVPPDRSSASIAIAGRRPDGLHQVELVELRKGTGWVPTRLAELVAKYQPSGVFCDAAGPAGSLLPDLQKAGVTVTAVTAKEYGQACGLFYDHVIEGRLRHLGQPELAAAIMAAVQRPLGEAWAWSRKNSLENISPVVAATLALWGVAAATPSPFALAW
jgi:phage terminase large subunit-like protein